MKAELVLGVVAAVAAAASVVIVATAKAPGAQCGPGFFPLGHRCCAAVSGDGKTCGPSRTCPAPLVRDASGMCAAPDVVVDVPETTITVGPSDWEADGIVRSRTIHVFPFAIDAFEITERRIHPGSRADPAQAAGRLARDEVIAYCAGRGGRLPTEDEWIVAASGARGTRYPWGDTGAVCRRAAWGLAEGPCAHGARGPDTVGAHRGGDSALGAHDLAGNVAEWVAPRPGEAGKGVVLGGSFRSQLASQLRVWSRAYADPGAHDPAIGGRCAYDLPRHR